MIVLDTNVVSEPLLPQPDPRVAAWLDSQPIDTLYLTTITLAELRQGVAILPEGRRKRTLDDRLERETIPLFTGRVLTFDEAASRAYAQVIVDARGAGRPIDAMDALIAAICVAHRYTLATRNVADFAGAGISLVNPWDVDVRRRGPSSRS
ncbi:MAG: type II toxin-antitoxin system VapC family toxin [Micrococcales bacterium]|nr:type II toxin-antitoxin system VapC family toxin [Micrococcales bacterium]